MQQRHRLRLFAEDRPQRIHKFNDQEDGHERKSAVDRVKVLGKESTGKAAQIV